MFTLGPIGARLTALPAHGVTPSDAVTFLIRRAPASARDQKQPEILDGDHVLGPETLYEAAPRAHLPALVAPIDAVVERGRSLGRDVHVPPPGKLFGISSAVPALELLREHIVDIARDARWAAAHSVRRIDDELTTLGAMTLGADTGVSRERFRSRVDIVEQARRYIDANPGRLVRLDELCRQTATSERALQYAFRGVTGASPAAYVRMTALHGARRELRDHGSPPVTVTAVAMRWGFWHLGRFAAAYRGAFGEPPSHTLHDAAHELPRPRQAAGR